MAPKWKELGGIAGYILLFGVIAYNLFIGSGIWTSLYRGAVVYLLYSILNIIITNILVKLLSDYEFRRLKELSAREEEEEMGRSENGEESHVQG